ncbi:MAG: OmpA family protein [Proteobacteria bacterium]|nr:OmpA family protein [Pseudomonadota bacterium]
MLKRFTGSALIGYKSAAWDQAVLPLSAETAHQQATGRDLLKDRLDVEGKVTRLVYLAPPGKTPLEVYRNHQQALAAAGFKQRFACERDCANLYFAWGKTVDVAAGMSWAKGGVPGQGNSSYPLTSALNFDGRLWVGTLGKGGQDVHVLLYTSSAADQSTNIAATYLEFVEPKAMPTGQVMVDAKALQGGLEAEGKVALYGIYFDTGKAELKPESRPQLDEMGKLLQAQAALKVYIVGHTDNQGSLEANLQLSQQRAQAVVAALAGGYKIDARRLQARGVASLAPLAGNGNDSGRARNRRVELVAQ